MASDSPISENDKGMDGIHFEDRLFSLVSDGGNHASINKFKKELLSRGIRDTDSRLAECMSNFTQCETDAIDKETFKSYISNNIVLVSKVFMDKVVIPDFDDFREKINDLYKSSKTNEEGNVSKRNSQLAKHNPDHWAVSVCTVDGQRHSVGDFDHPFCLQSVSKALTYSMVLDELGPEETHRYVGQEPSGSPFNAICLDRDGKPHNPMINTGAVMSCSLVKQRMDPAGKLEHCINVFKMMAGGELVNSNCAAYLAEKEIADQTIAIAHYMKANKCFPEDTKLNDVLDLHFQLSSVEINCDSGANIAATLANGGMCPTTDERVLTSKSVRDTLSLMFSCGMYDYSGQFAFKVGLPAKSGVSGCVLLVVPKVMGLCLWSPRIDVMGNSCRGIQFCEDFVKKFNFHNFDVASGTKCDPRNTKTNSHSTEVHNLLYAAYYGDVSAMKRFALQGVEMTQQDYDRRTALHVAAAEGKIHVVRFLIEKCDVDCGIPDRWGKTPLDDAKAFKKEDVVQLLETHMGKITAVTNAKSD